MKIKITFWRSKKILACTLVVSAVLMVGSGLAQPTSPATMLVEDQKTVNTTGGAGSLGGAGSSVGTGSSRSFFRIESVEPDQEKKDVAWLGVSTEEASEALASQLGLKLGQGLVVVYVAPESPAAKAEIQKYDVIEELDGQLLMNAGQLRKLVQLHGAGDTVKLALHRGGKKQTVSATLVKHTEGLASLRTESAVESFGYGMSIGGASNNYRLYKYARPPAPTGIDQRAVNIEVQRSMEDARAAIHDAFRARVQQPIPPADPARPAPPLPPLAPQIPEPPEAVDVGNDATVTVTQDGVAVKTIVKSDATGILILVASPKKHLTVHDPDGKLLFDGEIESEAQQQKVPAKIWEKVKPLLPQIKPPTDQESGPQAQSKAVR